RRGSWATSGAAALCAGRAPKPQRARASSKASPSTNAPPRSRIEPSQGIGRGTCLMGGARSQIATLVERHSRYVMLVKLDSKDTITVTHALKKKIHELPVELRRSLTWDRGSEMAAHKDFTIATDMQVYFCDPRSPWQRGSNENTN